MHLDIREKTTFITTQGMYCYKVMPFELKNIGATFQWMMTCVFEEQLGKHVEVYVDDLSVKSKKAD